MKFLFFSAIKSLFFAFCLLSLSGCIMVARKGIGQLRGTETEINMCPIAIPFDNTQYAVRLNIAPDADKLTGEESFLLEQLEKDFTDKAIQFRLLSSQSQGDTSRVSHQTLSAPVFDFQFNDIERSWLWNQLTLRGQIIIVNEGQKITRPFTVTTHKTFDVANSFLDSLSAKLSQCIIDENNQQALTPVSQP